MGPRGPDLAEPLGEDGDPLFATHVGGSVQVFRQQYVVSSDGQRFLLNTVTEEASTAPITVILNWKAKPQVP